MYIVSLTYTCEMAQIEQYLPEHLNYLEHYYKQGCFLASGRKVPRCGGIILANVADRAQLEQILHDDPFFVHQLADYQVTEFIPTKTAPELAAWRVT